jgi:hypothetical protein
MTLQARDEVSAKRREHPTGHQAPQDSLARTQQLSQWTNPIDNSKAQQSSSEKKGASSQQETPPTQQQAKA